MVSQDDWYVYHKDANNHGNFMIFLKLSPVFNI